MSRKPGQVHGAALATLASVPHERRKAVADLTAALRSRVFARAALLTVATGSASVLVGVSQVLLAHTMSIRQVGAFSFSISFLMLASLVFEFGLFLPLPRVIALQRRPEAKREMVGAALLLFAPVAGLFSGFVALAALVVDDLFQVHARDVLLAGATVAWPYAFLAIALLVAQGAEEIVPYSASYVLAPVAFVATLATLLVLHVRVGAATAILLRGSCYTLAALLLIRWLRPSCASARIHMATLRQECRRYGFKLYVGNVLALGTYQMDVLMLAALTNARTVALYAVATAISQAVALPGQGISSTLLSRMARSGRVPREWLTILCVVTGLGTLAVWLLAKPVLSVAFPLQYTAAAEYILPLAIAAGLRGITGIYNAQLAATANGRALRACALVLTSSNIALNFALIPPFQGMGAAIASAAAMLANLAAHIMFSRRAEQLSAEVDPAEPMTGA